MTMYYYSGNREYFTLLPKSKAKNAPNPGSANGLSRF